MKFNERFNIEVNLEEARKRFVNRIYNDIFLFYQSQFNTPQIIATTLGKKYVPRYPLIDTYLSSDFYENLEAIEGLFEYTSNKLSPSLDNPSLQIQKNIKEILSKSEVDLGILWENGKFLPTGAKLLDEKLINENLHWLRDKNYETVLEPFEKGLNHYLHSTKRPKLLSDVITDMYESLEAFSKIITNKNKDLSANRELLLRKIKVSSEYKVILKDYIEYACNFRHALESGKSKPNLDNYEVESFIYLTGIFIRLGIKSQS